MRIDSFFRMKVFRCNGGTATLYLTLPQASEAPAFNSLYMLLADAYISAGERMLRSSDKLHVGYRVSSDGTRGRHCVVKIERVCTLQRSDVEIRRGYTDWYDVDKSIFIK